MLINVPKDMESQSFTNKMFKTKDLLLLLFPIAVWGLGDKCDNCLPVSHQRPYLERGCKPFLSPECNCALYFDCPKTIPNEVLPTIEAEKLKKLGENACIFNHKVYAFEERLDTRCRVCHCRDSGKVRNVTGYMLKGDPFGPCADIECPEMFNNFIEPGCHRTFSTDKCCSTGKICQNDTKVHVECKHDNQTFGYGAKIYMKNDPCKVCLCDEKFNADNVQTSTCYDLQCNLALDTDKPAFIQQCTPVYFKNSCCSNGFICEKDFNPETSTMKPLSEKLTDKCILNGKQFNIGEKMPFTKEDTYSQGFSGGECQCRVPPLMSCTYST